MRSDLPTGELEGALKSQGYLLVAGVDEVGRGSWAGPVVAAAVMLPDIFSIKGVKDSKLLSSGQRIRLASQIKRRATAVGIGWASPAEIDEHGLSWAVRQSGERALKDMATVCEAVILDGKHNYLQGAYFSQAYVKADVHCLSVACASIVAKVTRDNYMQQMHALYPEYNFASNKGYGTPGHRLALRAGATPIHRHSWKPLSSQTAH